MNFIVTIGDANGISLEVFIKAVKENINSNTIQENNFTLIGNIDVIKQYISKINIVCLLSDNKIIISDKSINIIDVGYGYNVNFGECSKEAGLLSIKAVEQAAKLTLSKEYDAMITLPVNKEAISKTYPDFKGHTNFIADICGEKNPIMILFNENLRVALATVHIPIYSVSRRITKKRLCSLSKSFNKVLIKDFGVVNPKIAMLGLNPHAGENGVIGKEEKQIINPAIEISKKKGIDIYGAFASDGFFAQKDYKNFDGVIAMYHDQGLIPLKLISNGNGVNFTANLPIVRTSPDHGTGFDLAGKNTASAQSTFNSIEAAVSIVNSRNNNNKII